MSGTRCGPSARRGAFPVEEFRPAAIAPKALMAEAGLAALLLTREPELRYYTGFLTRFWESPTRPWFLVLPAEGAPVAVIPAIGAHLMGQTWLATSAPGPRRITRMTVSAYLPRPCGSMSR
jgi:Xaa-Pro aminopeptidase